MSSQPLKIKFEMAGVETKPCREVADFGYEHKTGQYFGKFYIGNRFWALVQFDDDDDPELYKAEGIEVMEPSWQKI